jgi:hypothetical protein
VTVNHVARWNSTSWSAFGAGLNSFVNSLTLLANGDLVAGGSFTTTAGGVTTPSVARWTGTSWTHLGLGLGGRPFAFANLGNGDLMAGGEFLTAGGNASPYLARLTSTCGASAVGYGSGCSSSTGPIVLTADNLPWVGIGPFRSTATGMGPNSVAFGLLGFTARNTPLIQFHPAAGPGCDLLASPDATILLIPVNGAATSQFGMPTSAVFAGVVLHNQILQIELDASLQLSLLSASNGLQLTIGAL